MTKALVILCGGRSSRMGTDKTFLPFGSESLLKYQIKRFKPYFDKIYISVQDKQDRAFDYQAYCGCEEIPDRYVNRGPMAGLYSCLRHAEEDILYFNAVDTPFSDPALAAQLCDELAASPEHYACLLKNPKGELQPLQGAYSKTIVPVMKEFLEAKRLALKAVLDHCPYLIHERFHSEDQFFNMNDPQSYYYGLQKLASMAPGQFPTAFAPGKEKSTDIPILSFAAKSGTGKTTYLEKLLPLLKKENIRIAVIKHDAHGFQMDKPGKDSYRLTQAGADHMILTSTDQTASIITHKNENPDLAFLLSKVQDVDLIITEGYKLANMPKLELLRKGYNEVLRSNQENLLGIICDFPYETDLPVFPLNEPEDLVPFILEYIKK